jgi:hypothetical protein
MVVTTIRSRQKMPYWRMLFAGGICLGLLRGHKRKVYFRETPSHRQEGTETTDYCRVC